ncbi:MAG: hypothetical protein ACX98W_14895 [bacterium]
MTYKKAWGIDITDRVRPYLQGRWIKIPALELPAGNHAVEISIMNQREEATRMTFSVTVQD